MLYGIEVERTRHRKAFLVLVLEYTYDDVDEVATCTASHANSASFDFAAWALLTAVTA